MLCFSAEHFLFAEQRNKNPSRDLLNALCALNLIKVKLNAFGAWGFVIYFRLDVVVKEGTEDVLSDKFFQ